MINEDHNEEKRRKASIWQREKLRREAEKEDLNILRKNYFLVANVLAVILVGFLILYKEEKLDENYRWTVGIPIEIKEEFHFDFPVKTKNLYYSFQVGNQDFKSKYEIQDYTSPNEYWLKKPFFIRFSPEDPENCDVPQFTRIPSFLNPSEYPKNGVHKDSLISFLNKKKEGLLN